jgi:hypothetical protein
MTFEVFGSLKLNKNLIINPRNETKPTTILKPFAA